MHLNTEPLVAMQGVLACAGLVTWNNESGGVTTRRGDATGSFLAMPPFGEAIKALDMAFD